MNSKKYCGKTKIVCTIGPSVATVDKIVQLIDAGMDAARLNFSHGTQNEHLNYIQNIRKATKITGKNIAIIQDLQGPKIRIGKLHTEPIVVKKNDKIIITTDSDFYSHKSSELKIPTTYMNLPQDVKKGDKILIDDGKIELTVINVKGSNITCKVIDGGELYSNKGINLPGVAVSSPALTEKDKNDLDFGIKHGIDYCALSFVRSTSDIEEIKKYITQNSKQHIPVIAKIEKPEALNRLDDIIKIADCVIVARGDLGVEISLEEVPLIQKEIIRKCNELGKPVIVATQMLESMINNPRPTRAEVSDVANAVLDGADAVMLSGETSVGKYPIDAVKIMDKIAKSVEKKHVHNFSSGNLYNSLARSAVGLSDQLEASAIIVITFSGEAAIRVANFRPAAPIIAVTENESVSRKLNLVWGVQSIVLRNLKNNTALAFEKIQKKLLDEGLIEKGNIVVMLAGLPLFEQHLLNTIKIFYVENGAD
ncbi:MAG: pyruvate kinase [Bacteroidota bacterium]|nr:pyruvate kinase [Bacteroidota bacterium]